MGRAFDMGRTAILCLILASSGCVSVPPVHSDGGASTTEKAAPAAPTTAPAPIVPMVSLRPEPGLFATPGIIARGTSPDGDGELDQAPPLYFHGGLTELPTCSLNPIIAVMAGDTSSKRTDDAFQSMAMLGMNGAIHILRGLGGSPASHGQNHFHRSADVLDDILQPDDDSMRARQVRPPCFFTLGCNF